MTDQDRLIAAPHRLGRKIAWAIIPGIVAALAASQSAHAQSLTGFTAGDIVVSVSGRGALGDTNTYLDNQASPLTLQQFSLVGTASATPAGQLVLPQVTVGANSAISAEYGSSSEGNLALSQDGQSLVIAGYGVNAASYNANTIPYGGTAGTPLALAQTTSVPGGANTAVTRVIADVRADASVDTSTQLLNVFNTNNPRSVATVNGSSFYIGGQGVSGDTTEGVFLAQDGATSATAIYTARDVRTVEINNGQLSASLDSKVGSGQTANIATYGTGLPTAAVTPVPLAGLQTGSPKSPAPSTVALGNGNGNSVNLSKGSIYLSPENYFYANGTTLYVADSGNPKAGGLGDGGLQKWSLVSNTWILDYTLSSGLNLVAATASAGTTGLIGLTGQVVGNNVFLYATNSTINDTDQTYLYGITDSLSTISAPGNESFTTLVTAGADSNIRGVAFAPQAAAVPEPASMAVLATGLLGLAGMRRRRR